MEISGRAVENILSSWRVAVLSTYGKRTIHSVPVVFVPVEGQIYTPIDGKPKSAKKLQRVVDIERDPRFTLLLQHYSENWTELWWLRLSGRAHVLAGGDLDTDLSERIIAGLRARYLQYEKTAVLSDGGALIGLSVSTHTAWAWQGAEWLERRFA